VYFDEQQESMRPLTRGILAFLVCFAVGALLSALSGLGDRHWFPAGIAASSVVAIYVFRSSQKENANWWSFEIKQQSRRVSRNARAAIPRAAFRTCDPPSRELPLAGRERLITDARASP